ncbi:MAG TPA: hemerythrin domain-containing protein [Acidimicrobiales bacterium]|nr:hemerythrin domain-containing protein [Acidimicrobiales bacterium]
MANAAGKSIVAKLLQDHQEVKQLFSRMDQTSPAQAREMFWELTNDLVRHEVAEEEIVYPEVRKSVPNGDRLADARIKEQSKAEELLAEMEKAGTDDPQFSSRLQKLQKAVLEHAEKEETLVFEPLGQHLDQDRLEQLGSRYDKAKAAAPTHPHPSAPDTPPGNMALGPVAALVDRARDAMHKVAS